ncbi:MAG: hypothetical protein AB7W37_04935 [Syntrophobacteraceae bacterium]
MKSIFVKHFLYRSTIVFFMVLAVGAGTAWSGGLRITMRDGTTVDAPYFWEEGGQVKFDVPGGVAGIPKDQVASIQEVLDSKAFDPQVLAENRSAVVASPMDSELRGLISAQLPSSPSRKLDSEEASQMLREENLTKKGQIGESIGKTYAPAFKQHGDFNELVRYQGDQLALLMRSILSSQFNLTSYNFMMVFYDAEGNILQRKACDVKELHIDAKELKKLGVREKFYSVSTMVLPDPKIARYELTAMKQ